MRFKVQFRIVLDQIETFWMQKSKVEAIRGGDRNTWSFHTSTVIRQKFNLIEVLQNDDGEWVTDPDEVRSMVWNFFQGLYTEEQTQNVAQEPWGVSFSRLTAEQQEGLATPFTSREVLAALKSMAALKAPGPNSYHAYFFKQYWAIAGICKTVLDILGGKEMPVGLNDTFLSLIPKVNNP